MTAMNVEGRTVASPDDVSQVGSGAPDGAPSGVVLEPRKIQIMEATERLIAEYGFDGLRLRDVSKTAGVSIGMIQHYFETRDGLVLEGTREGTGLRCVFSDLTATAFRWRAEEAEGGQPFRVRQRFAATRREGLDS